MELTPHHEQQVGAFGFSIGPGYPYVPTMVDLDISWSAASAAAAPEPARATCRLWVPDAGDEVLFRDTVLAKHEPQLGSPMLSLFTIDDLKTRPVLAFAGRVDSVTRARSRSTGGGTRRLSYYLVLDPSTTMSWQHSPTSPVVTTPVDQSEGTLKVTVPPQGAWSGSVLSNFAMGVLPIPSVPNHSELWVTEGTVDRFITTRLSDNPALGDLPLPAPRGFGAWFWRANGQYKSVAEGPLVIGATRPPDLALVAYGRMSTSTTRPLVATRPLLYRTNTPHRRPSGWWLTVTASDDLAAAGRHKIGDVPWSEETALTRLQRIGSLSAPPFPVPVLRGTGSIPEPIRTQLSTVRVAPQDVDAKPMLEVASRALAPVGAIPLATRGGVVAARPNLADTDTSTTVTIPPAAVPDVEQSIENVNITNKVTITYLDPLTEPGELTERQVTIKDQASIDAWGESTARWETIATLTSTRPLASHDDVVGRAIAQLNAAMAASLTPRMTFARPVMLCLDELVCELMLNGDLEASSPTFLYGTGASLLTTELAHTGKRVLRLAPSAFANASARSPIFPVPAPPSQYAAVPPVELSMWVRPDPDSVSDTYVRIGYHEVVGTTQGALKYATGDVFVPARADGWQQVKATIYPASSTTGIRFAPTVMTPGRAGAVVFVDTMSAHTADPSHSCRSIEQLLNLDTRHGARVAIPHTLPDVPNRFHLIGGSIAMSRGDVAVALNLRPAN